MSHSTLAYDFPVLSPQPPAGKESAPTGQGPRVPQQGYRTALNEALDFRTPTGSELTHSLSTRPPARPSSEGPTYIVETPSQHTNPYPQPNTHGASAAAYPNAQHAGIDGLYENGPGSGITSSGITLSPAIFRASMIAPRSQYLYPGHDMDGLANYGQATPLPPQSHDLEDNGELRSFLGLASAYANLTGRPNSPDYTNDERIRREIQVRPRDSSQPNQLDLADVVDVSVLAEDQIDVLLSRTAGGETPDTAFEEMTYTSHSFSSPTSESSTTPPFAGTFQDTFQPDFMSLGYSSSPTSTFVTPGLLDGTQAYTMRFDGFHSNNGDGDTRSPPRAESVDEPNDDDDAMGNAAYSVDEEPPPSTSALSRSTSYRGSMSTSAAPEDRPKKSLPKRSRRDARRVPLDAPIQPRTYHGPSRTARKDLPRGFAAKIDAKQLAGVKRALEAEEEDDVDVDPQSKEVAQNLSAKIVQKREKNTMAARKSRQKKAEHVQTLENELRQKDQRIEELEALVRKQEIEINILKDVVNQGHP